jgi:hypothetical protein
MLEDRLPGEHPNKGWNRASIMFWSRRPYVPRMRPEDRRLPSNLGGARLFGTCVLAAACVTAACVWPPLFFASIFLGLSGQLCGGVLVAALVGLTFVFYFWVARETRRDRRLLARY